MLLTTAALSLGALAATARMPCFASLLLLLSCYSQAFNLDTQAPVVKQGGAYADSYFGYSVAQHRTATSGGEALLLVGAPRDRNLQPGTQRSGALYQCPLTAFTGDCVQVATDGRRHDDNGGGGSNSSKLYGMYDGRIANLLPPLGAEIKEDQWLGVSLASQGPGGQVIVCAHRYTVRDVDRVTYEPIDSKRAMLGLCYILQPDLSLPADTSIGAKNVLVVREALRGKKLEPVNDFDNHARYGVCQVGTAAAWAKSEHLVNSNHSNNVHNSNRAADQGYALFGAPGCYTWRGNLFGQQRNGLTTGGYAAALHEDNYARFTKHGHMGLALTSGHYFGRAAATVHFASGAPGAGEVYFFTANDLTGRLALDEERTIGGGNFGGGFGFSLETLDANRDSRDDLVVGAPFCDNKGRGGSVFLYLSAGGSGVQPDRYLEIRGATAEGQFGLAIARLGDLNRDGYEDFAVGAPYEDRGAVYVFLGSPHGVGDPSSTPAAGWLKAEEASSQLIRAAELLAAGRLPLPANLATFGSSLSGGQDMDGNSYPDLLVGAYQSGVVMLLHARPIINVTTTLELRELDGVDPGRAGCELDPGSAHSCFAFSACFRVEAATVAVNGSAGGPRRQSRENMAIRFLIVAEPGKSVSRVWLRIADTPGTSSGRRVGGNGGGGNGVRSSRVENVLYIQEGGEECTTLLGYLSDTRQTDLQTPVRFALSYSLIQDEPVVNYNGGGGGLPSVDRYPILNQAQARRTFHATFQRNCGDDEVCQAQLVVRPQLRDRDGAELSRVVVAGGASSGGGVYQLELGSLTDNQLILDIGLQNLGEAAYEARLDIVHSSSLSYVGLGNASDLSAPRVLNATTLSFDLGNPFKGPGPLLNLQLRFAPQRVINETLIVFEFHVDTTSQLAVDASTYLTCLIVRRAELKIGGRSWPPTVNYGGTGGEIKGESAMRDLAEIGPLVQHRYQVRNWGPSEVDVVTVRIKWPYQVENGRAQGKWLLYLTEQPVLRNGNGFCTLAVGQAANPLNLTAAKSDHQYQSGRRGLSRSAPAILADSLDMSNNNQLDVLLAEKFYADVVAPDLSMGADVTGLAFGGGENSRSLKHRRRRRDIEQVVAPIRVLKQKRTDGGESSSEEDLVVRLDCELGTAKCLLITCQVYNLPARHSVSVEIRARLWNATLVEDYFNVVEGDDKNDNSIDRVEIFSKAQVIVDSVYTQDVSNDFEAVVTVALPDRQLEPDSQRLDWWIYAVSAACGLLVLVLIVLVLWRLGFFERRRPASEDDDDSDFMMSAHFVEKVKLNGNTDF